VELGHHQNRLLLLGTTKFGRHKQLGGNAPEYSALVTGLLLNATCISCWTSSSFLLMVLIRSRQKERNRPRTGENQPASKNGSTFKVLLVLQQRTLSLRAASWTHRGNPTSAACTCDAPFWSMLKIHDVMLAKPVLTELRPLQCFKAFRLQHITLEVKCSCLCFFDTSVNLFVLLPFTRDSYSWVEKKKLSVCRNAKLKQFDII